MKYFKYLAFLLPFLAINVKGAQAVEDTKIGEVRVLFYDDQTKKLLFKKPLTIYENKDLSLSRLMVYIANTIKNKIGYNIKHFLLKEDKIFTNRDKFKEDFLLSKIELEECSSMSDLEAFKYIGRDFSKVKKKEDQLKSYEEVLFSLDKSQTLKKLIKSDENEFYMIIIGSPIKS